MAKGAAAAAAAAPTAARQSRLSRIALNHRWLCCARTQEKARVTEYITQEFACKSLRQTHSDPVHTSKPASPPAG